MILNDLRFSVFDVETTGLSPDARITEAAVTHLDPGRLPRVAFTARVNPGIPIERGASLVTGITDDDLKDCPTWVEIGPKVAEAMDGRVVIAYNSPYDFGRLRFENQRCGLPLPTWGSWIDPFVLIRTEKLDKFKKGKKLSQACERRGIAVDAHGAAGDTVATALLWRLIVEKLGIGNLELDRYLRKQRLTALELEREFCKYLQKEGSDGEQPSCAWHELEGEPMPPWPPRQPAMGKCFMCASPAVFRIDKAGTVGIFNPNDSEHACAGWSTSSSAQ